jgi:HAD superfamily hydrolase (TIGR01490 family)
MSCKRKIALFDFDGTLIHGDSLFSFVMHSRGYFVFYLGMIFILPLMLTGYLGIISRSTVKEWYLRYFFHNYDSNDFRKACENYKGWITNHVKQISILELSKRKEDGYEIWIVSASVGNWIIPWAKSIGVDKIIATEILFDANDRFVGFASSNCNGDEKVNRIKEFILNKESCSIIAYGDSNNDIPMFEYANEAYKVKNNKIVRYEKI